MIRIVAVVGVLVYAASSLFLTLPLQKLGLLTHSMRSLLSPRLPDWPTMSQSAPQTLPQHITPEMESAADAILQRLQETEQTVRDAIASDESVAIETELSVVMPCLNEADTLAICIEKAQRAMRGAGIEGEVIVADNGSTDGSQEIARRLGARVVPVTEKGYGNALMGGIRAALGEYVIMGDADDSYDFLEIPKFVDKLRAGHELVQGCRLPSGGGKVLPGAMPPSHRWLGNPMFSWLVQRMFNAPIHDVYCGLRGFTKKLYNRLDLRCTGMEFATEMIIKSSLFEVDIAEVPTTLHPDGRKAHAPHLRTFRDGWRTLRFFLMYSPRWLFLVPGIGLAIVGLVGYLLAMPGTSVLGATLDAYFVGGKSLDTLRFSIGAIRRVCQDICHLGGTTSRRFSIGRLLESDESRALSDRRHFGILRGLGCC